MVNNYSVKNGNYRVFGGYIVKVIENPQNERNVNHVMLYKNNVDEDFVDDFECQVGSEFTTAEKYINKLNGEK